MLLLKTEKPRHKEGQILPSVVQWARRSHVLYAPGQCFIPVPQPRPLSSVMGEAQKLVSQSGSWLLRHLNVEPGGGEEKQDCGKR